MPRLYDATAEAIDRRIGWDKLPLPIAMLVLIGLRNILRKLRTSTTPAAGRSTSPTSTTTPTI